MTNDEIAERIARRIDQAIRRNIGLEIAIIAILVIVASVGIYLLINGANERRWELLATGSACQAAIGWPIAQLLEIRRFNVLLQTLPELIRMADTEGRKELVFKLVEKLMDKL